MRVHTYGDRTLLVVSKWSTQKLGGGITSPRKDAVWFRINVSLRQPVHWFQGGMIPANALWKPSAECTTSQVQTPHNTSTGSDSYPHWTGMKPKLTKEFAMASFEASERSNCPCIVWMFKTIQRCIPFHAQTGHGFLSAPFLAIKRNQATGFHGHADLLSWPNM